MTSASGGFKFTKAINRIGQSSLSSYIYTKSCFPLLLPFAKDECGRTILWSIAQDHQRSRLYSSAAASVIVRRPNLEKRKRTKESSLRGQMP